ncbi:putative PP-loop ATPase superfamily protein [Lineolata rhizophorae]|uniref:Cytoplasmic tRNA 2-thiolation protein 1 n=1 Tax=Lineolata rhizophorae TaxID=578093 RepID=A0A6A6P9J3_9PEZI|nr:putative PP-loop ATPase superfamily protein [Lineolata rhizophorae]
MPPPCTRCQSERAVIVRPKNYDKLCKTCFLEVFEAEVHKTITTNALFYPGERVAIGASGGKDSTVLASVLKTLNTRHGYGLDLILLSIDEGITGYRDHSLETVKRNAVQYDLPLKVLSYTELYGWTMDQVVEQVGKKGNCTYCGVFRRQALDRGAASLGVRHVVTGHNADDVAETVLMNLLRGDLPRLSRTASIVTSTPSSAQTDIKRSKPLKYAYEKEIVLYAHHKNLDYFSTECIYSPEAFRGSARTLVKDLERVRPSSILDIVRSGEDMATLVPASVAPKAASGRESRYGGENVSVVYDLDEGTGGCGSANGRDSGGEMARMEHQLRTDQNAATHGLETEVTMASLGTPTSGSSIAVGVRPSHVQMKKANGKGLRQQTAGACERCGYISSQAVCKACVLLEGLNKNRPKASIGIEKTNDSETLDKGLAKVTLAEKKRQQVAQTEL